MIINRTSTYVTTDTYMYMYHKACPKLMEWPISLEFNYLDISHFFGRMIHVRFALEFEMNRILFNCNIKKQKPKFICEIVILYPIHNVHNQCKNKTEKKNTIQCMCTLTWTLKHTNCIIHSIYSACYEKPESRTDDKIRKLNYNNYTTQKN